MAELQVKWSRAPAEQSTKCPLLVTRCTGLHGRQEGAKRPSVRRPREHELQPESGNYFLFRAILTDVQSQGRLSAHQRMNLPLSPDMLLLRMWIGLGNFRRIDKVARYRRHDDDNVDCSGDRPINGGRSALCTGRRLLRRSRARRLAFASSSIPLRASARFLRSSGSQRFAACSMVSHWCCRSS
jgi:hypothetical protein